MAIVTANEQRTHYLSLENYTERIKFLRIAVKQSIRAQLQPCRKNCLENPSAAKASFEAELLSGMAEAMP